MGPSPHSLPLSPFSPPLPILSMSNHQVAFPICLALLGATLLAIGAIGFENRRLLAQCEPIYGTAQCELRILGR